jgi:threonine dehydratase
MASLTLSQTAGATVFLKCENFQLVGAIKLRGVYHAIALLPPSQQAGLIVTSSSDNHAQGVALAPLFRREEALIGKRVGMIITGGNVDLSSFFATLS